MFRNCVKLRDKKEIDIKRKKRKETSTEKADFYNNKEIIILTSPFLLKRRFAVILNAKIAPIQQNKLKM